MREKRERERDRDRERKREREINKKLVVKAYYSQGTINKVLSGRFHQGEDLQVFFGHLKVHVS